MNIDGSQLGPEVIDLGKSIGLIADDGTGEGQRLGCPHQDWGGFHAWRRSWR